MCLDRVGLNLGLDSAGLNQGLDSAGLIPSFTCRAGLVPEV